MKTFLLATVSMVALTSVAREAEIPENARPFSSVPVVDWNAGHIGIQGGIAHKEALSKESTGTLTRPFLRDGRRTGGAISAVGYTSLATAPARAGLAPSSTLSYAAGEARAGAFSINDAISLAVLTNPGVGEASANHRATES
jgi:hypothetical protein